MSGCLRGTCDKPWPRLQFCWSWTHHQLFCKRHAAYSEHPVWEDGWGVCEWKRSLVHGTGCILPNHLQDNAYCATDGVTAEAASFRNTTYRATEGEEGLDKLVLWEEGMPSHQVNESSKSTSPAFNELPLRDGGQDCGPSAEKTAREHTRSVRGVKVGAIKYKE